MATDNVNIKIQVDSSQAVKSTESYKKQLADLKAQMTNLKVETDNLTKASAEQINEYNSLLQKAGAITDALADTASEIKSLSDDYSGLTATMQGIGAGVAGITAVQGAMALFGTENEAVAETLQKVQGAMALLNSVQTIAKALDQSSALMTVLRTKAQQNLNKELIKTNAAETAGVGAMGAYSTAEGVATAGAGALTVGVKAVGTAIKSIPVVGWILAAIAALTTLITLIVQANDEETEGERLERERIRNQNMINEAREEGIKAIQKDKVELDLALDAIENNVEGTDEWKKGIEAVSNKLGLSKKWVMQNVEQVKTLAETWLEVKKIQATADELTKKLAESRAKQLTFEIEVNRVNSLSYEDREEAMEKLREEYQLTEEQSDRLLSAMHDQRTSNEKDYRAATNMIADVVKEVNSSYERMGQALEGALKSEMKNLEEVSKGLEEAKKQSAELEEQEKKSDERRKKAASDRKTQEDNDRKEREKAESDVNTFILNAEKNRLKETEKLNSQTYEGRLQNIENEKKAVEASFDEQIKKATELFGEESTQVKQLEALKISAIDTVSKKEDDERKKQTQLEKDEQLKRNKVKADTALIGLQEGTVEYLLAYKEQLNAEMELELANTALTEEEKANIRAEYRQKEIEADDAYMQAQTEKELAAIQAKYDAMTDMVSGFSTLVTSLQDAELANAEGNEKKQAEIRRKYARMNFLSQIAGIGIDTAKGIMSVWSTAGELGPIAGPIVGAIQTAMIAGIGIAQTIKAKNEMNNALKAEKGGLLMGRSHANGGIPVGNTGVEVEGGEFIINRRATSQFAPLLSAINSYSGPSAPSMNTLSMTSGSGSSVDRNLISQIVSETVRGVGAIPVVVTEHSITKAQRNVSVIENQALL